MQAVQYKSFEHVNGKIRWYFIIETVHGLCKVSTHNYDSNKTLSIASAIDKTSYFISECNAIHNDKYDYTLTVYETSKKKVTITCPIHGNFKQLPTAHKNYNGCPCCASLVSNMYEPSLPKNLLTINLYIIKCYNDIESFYKIGITSKDVNARFKYNHQMPYDYEIIEFYNDDISIITNLESHLHSELSIKKYIPQKKFAGHTECFECIESWQTIMHRFINNLK